MLGRSSGSLRSHERIWRVGVGTLRLLCEEVGGLPACGCKSGSCSDGVPSVSCPAALLCRLVPVSSLTPGGIASTADPWLHEWKGHL